MGKATPTSRAGIACNVNYIKVTTIVMPPMMGWEQENHWLSLAYHLKLFQKLSGGRRNEIQLLE